MSYFAVRQLTYNADRPILINYCLRHLQRQFLLQTATICVFIIITKYTSYRLLISLHLCAVLHNIIVLKRVCMFLCMQAHVYVYVSYAYE